MYTSSEKFYQIKIVSKTNGCVCWHTGGNILFNTPASNSSRARVYTSLSGAKKALQSVRSHLGHNLEASIEVFNPVYGI